MLPSLTATARDDAFHALEAQGKPAAAAVTPVISLPKQDMFVLAIRLQHASSNPRPVEGRSPVELPYLSRQSPFTQLATRSPGNYNPICHTLPRTDGRIHPNSRSSRRPPPLHHALTPRIHPPLFLTAVAERATD